LMRLWALGTFAWVVYWGWYLSAHCSPVTDNPYYLVACEINTLNSTTSGYTTLSNAFVLYILLPSSSLAFGYLIAWMVRGFRAAQE
jgi:hypothetical protein